MTTAADNVVETTDAAVEDEESPDSGDVLLF